MRSKPDPDEIITRVKKDGQWFFSRYPEEQLRFKRIDGQWFMLEPRPAAGGGEGGEPFDGNMHGETIINLGNAINNNDAVSKAVCKGWDMYTLDAAKEYTDEEIKKINIPSVDGLATQEWVYDQSYITEQPVTDGDAATLEAANKYTDDQIAGIEVPDVVEPDVNKQYVDNADQAVQRFATTADEAILNSAKKYTDDSLGAIPEVSEPDVDKAYVDAELAKKLSASGSPGVVQDWRIRSPKGEGNQTYLKIADDHLHLYHVADPTNDEHGVSRGYADGRYQIQQIPVVMKTTGSMACVTVNEPPSKSFCGLYNTSPGSSTNGNMYFGNWNADIRVHIDGLKNPENEEFAANEKYFINGFVSIFGKDDGKLYFKHAITQVMRPQGKDYINLHFATRFPAYGAGQNDSQSKYVLIVEGLMNKAVNTVNIPDEE